LKRRLLKETGFIIIASLLVLLSYLIAGTFFEIWIHDYKLMIILAAAFYLIIGFYRLLNHLAKKYHEEEDQDHLNVKKS
jgi:hypothetical protein